MIRGFGPGFFTGGTSQAKKLLATGWAVASSNRRRIWGLAAGRLDCVHSHRLSCMQDAHSAAKHVKPLGKSIPIRDRFKIILVRIELLAGRLPSAESCATNRR